MEFAVELLCDELAVQIKHGLHIVGWLVTKGEKHKSFKTIMVLGEVYYF